jgi:hypothetical protein
VLRSIPVIDGVLFGELRLEESQVFSQASEGLFMFLDCDWSRVDDAAFPVLDGSLDFAFCFCDLAQ